MITTASLPNVLDKPNLRYLAVKMPFSNLSRRNLLITTFKKIMYLPDRGCATCMATLLAPPPSEKARRVDESVNFGVRRNAQLILLKCVYTT